MAIESLSTTMTLTPRRKLRSSILLPGVDILTMTAAFWLGGLVNLSYQNWSLERTCILAALSAACLAAFHQLGHYSRRRPFWQEVGDVIIVALLALVADAALLYLLKVNFSRVWVLTSWVAVIGAVPLVRAAAKQLSARLGAWRQPTVVVGTGRNALEAALAFACDNHIGFPNHLGYEIVAFIDPSGRADGPARLAVAGRSVPVEPIDADAQSLPGWLGRPHIIVALELDEMASRESFIENLSLRYGDIDVVTPLRGLPINRARVTHFFSQDFVSFRIYNNLARPWSQALKRFFDLLVGTLLLTAAAPLMAVIAWQVAKSGGPVFFAHERIGRHGQLFRCWKFRTMVPNAAAALADLLAKDQAAKAEWDRDFKLKNDPRITPIGRWLRQTSFDELPQLFNVLRGEMSLVGPRPVVRDELRRYGDAQVYYTQVRPGLTGLWQVSGRNDVDYARRIHLDAWYVRNWNLWYDVIILARTSLAVLNRGGAY
jgi:undecaprenyl-phosphate galactose phosphotransferase